MNTIEISDDDLKMLRRVLWAAYLRGVGEVAEYENYRRLDNYFDNGETYV